MKNFISAFFITLFILSISNLGYAQQSKTNKDELSYQISAFTPLEKELKTYGLEFENKTELEIPSQEEFISNFGTYERVSSSPDFIIKLQLNSYTPESYVTTYKGNAMGAGTEQKYNYVFKAKVTANIKIYTPKDYANFYQSGFKNVGDFNIVNESTEIFSSESDAKAALAKVEKEGTKSIKEKTQKMFVSFVDKYLNRQFIGESKKEYLPLWTIKSKKLDYSEIDKAYQIYQEATKNIYPLSEESSVLLVEAIDIWKKAIEELDPSNKKARISVKNVGGLYLNVAIANIWLNQYDEANTYFEKGQKSKGNEMWKPVIKTLLTNRAIGFKQNILKEKGQLNITKDFSEAPRVYPEDFKLTDTKWRLKAMTELSQRGNPWFTYEFSYDSDVVVHQKSNTSFQSNYYYNDEDLTVTQQRVSNTGILRDTLKVSTFKSGKVEKYRLYSNLGNRFKDYLMHYDDSGNWLGYEEKEGIESLTINYKDAQIDSYELVSVSSTIDKNKIRTLFKLHWLGDRLDSITIDRINALENTNQKSTKKLIYDSRGRLVKVTGSFGSTTSFEYDTNGNVTKRVIRSDSGSKVMVYEWEKGSGNTLVLDVRAVKESLLAYIYRINYHTFIPIP